MAKISKTLASLLTVLLPAAAYAAPARERAIE